MTLRARWARFSLVLGIWSVARVAAASQPPGAAPAAPPVAPHATTMTGTPARSPAPRPAPASASAAQAAAVPTVMVTPVQTGGPGASASPNLRAAAASPAAPVAAAPVDTGVPAPPTPQITVPSQVRVQLDSAAQREQFRQAEYRRYRRARGMIAGGWALFGTTYAISLLTGSITLDVTGNSRLRSFGGSMMIPAVGPFIAAFHTRYYTPAVFTALLGAAQVAGLVLAIVGHTRRARYRRKMAIAAVPTSGGGSVSVTMRF